MKYLVQMGNGQSYFVDTKKPDSQVEILHPDYGWHESSFLKNKDFVFYKNTIRNYAFCSMRNKGFNSWKLTDDFGTIIARLK